MTTGEQATVGRIVHLRMSERCIAALVIEEDGNQPVLHPFPPTTGFQPTIGRYGYGALRPTSGTLQDGTWHWPREH